MPANCPLVGAIRAFARCRMMNGMRCSTDERLARLRQYILEYKNLCSVSSAEWLSYIHFHLILVAGHHKI